MTIIGRIDVGGSQFFDSDIINVTSSVGEFNSTSKFNATFPNCNGQHKTDFSISDVIEVYADATKIFKGAIEDLDFSGRPNNGTITISGRDGSALLVDTTIEPIVYRNMEVSTIVTAIMVNVPGITVTNVQATSTTLTYIAFNHTSVFDALRRLAELSGFYFYVDVDYDLHFERKSSISSGSTLDNTNVLSSSFKTSDSQMANRCWVYGDRVLTRAPIATFTSDGGSVFTLTDKPHNTKVIVGANVYNGGVFNNISEAPSGTQYWVDFDLQNIILISGTQAGNNLVASGGSFNVEFDRSLPIIKYTQDNTSIGSYGFKDRVIVDTEIKEPLLARDIAVRNVAEDKNPKSQGDLDLEGLISLTAGNTVLVNLPNENVSNETFDIIEVKYKFTQKTSQSEKIISVRVSRKIKDVVDTIKQLINDVKALQASNAIDTNFVSRLESSFAQNTIRVKAWTLNTRNTGSSFVLGGNVNGRLGSIAGVQPILGSGTVGAYVTVGSFSV